MDARIIRFRRFFVAVLAFSMTLSVLCARCQAAPVTMKSCAGLLSIQDEPCAGEMKSGVSSQGRTAKNSKTIPNSLDGLKAFMGSEYTCFQFDNFLIASDLDPKTVLHLASQDFLQNYSVLSQNYFQRARDYYDKNPGFILTIFLFRDRESYLKGLRLIGHDEIASAEEDNQKSATEGFFYSGGSYNHIVINYRDNYERGLGTFVHELTHALLRKEIPSAPLWLNEGMATLLGNAELINSQFRMKNDKNILLLQKAIEKGMFVPLQKLMTVTSDEFYGKAGIVYYPSASYFCKFLEDKNRLRDFYREYRDSYKGDPTGAKTLEKIMGLRLDELEGDWRAWLERQTL